MGEGELAINKNDELDKKLNILHRLTWNIKKSICPTREQTGQGQEKKLK